VGEPEPANTAERILRFVQLNPGCHLRKNKDKNLSIKSAIELMVRKNIGSVVITGDQLKLKK
jgi:hypothetical protein